MALAADAVRNAGGRSSSLCDRAITLGVFWASSGMIWHGMMGLREVSGKRSSVIGCIQKMGIFSGAGSLRDFLMDCRGRAGSGASHAFGAGTLVIFIIIFIVCLGFA